MRLRILAYFHTDMVLGPSKITSIYCVENIDLKLKMLKWSAFKNRVSGNANKISCQ